MPAGGGTVSPRLVRSRRDAPRLRAVREGRQRAASTPTARTSRRTTAAAPTRSPTSTRARSPRCSPPSSSAQEANRLTRAQPAHRERRDRAVVIDVALLRNLLAWEAGPGPVPRSGSRRTCQPELNLAASGSSARKRSIDSSSSQNATAGAAELRRRHDRTAEGRHQGNLGPAQARNRTWCRALAGGRERRTGADVGQMHRCDHRDLLEKASSSKRGEASLAPKNSSVRIRTAARRPGAYSLRRRWIRRRSSGSNALKTHTSGSCPSSRG